MSTETEYARGYKMAKEMIQEVGLQTCWDGYNNGAIGDDYDRGFMKALRDEMEKDDDQA